MDGAPQTPFVMSKPKTVLARLHAQGSLEVKHFIPYGIRYFLTRSLLRRDPDIPGIFCRTNSSHFIRIDAAGLRAVRSCKRIPLCLGGL